MNSKTSIAIVEDHDDLRDAFVEHLRSSDFDVTGLICGEELDEYLVHQLPAILILDIGLPGEDGFSIAKRIRRSHPGMRIIMLTCLTESADKIHGYDCGADLYLPKPVSPEELNAAVGAATRRLNIRDKAPSTLRLNLQKSTISRGDSTVQLNPQERSIIRSLAEANERKVHTWRLLEILSEISGLDAEKPYLEVQVFRLRKKLLEIGATEPAIQSIWKEGYKLLDPVEIVAN